MDIPDLIAHSTAMADVLKMIRTVAPSDVNILIQGETGSGKEKVARAIHQLSPRKDNTFVVVDCAAIPEMLLESTLFGHEKGAFTGAANSKPGMLELAQGGTLLMDEIGEIPLQLQAKLLRAIQEQRFFRVGGVKEIHTDYRLLAATHRNLDEAVSRGLFREDLYYRLKVISLEVPPLRQRIEDIAPLALEFLQRFSKRHHKAGLGIAPDAIRCLQLYRWPGNVRQLENTLERAVVMAQQEDIRVFDLPAEITGEVFNRRNSDGGTQEDSLENTPQLPSLKEFRQRVIQNVEEEYAIKALQYTRGNVTAAAKMAGISSRSFYRLLDRCGVGADDIRKMRRRPVTPGVTRAIHGPSPKL